MTHQWKCRWVICIMGVIAFSGCDGKGLEIVPVNGVIAFDSGPCPTDGTIYFSPLEVAVGLPKRPGVGRFNTDGKFMVTSFRPGDGLVPGRYSVSIECFEGPVDPFNPEAGSFIAKGAEWPELVIEQGTRDPVVVNYDVPRKK